MRLCARELPLAPRPLEIARRLAGEDPFAFLWCADGSGRSFVAVRPIAHSDRLDPEPELGPEQSPSELASVPRWIGLLPYEARRELERPGHTPAPDPRAEPHVSRPLWLRFGAVVCVGERVHVVGDDRQSVQELSQALLRATPRPDPQASLRPLPGEAPERHAERVRAALELIAEGEIYEVNLARRLEFRVEGHSLDVLVALCRGQRPRHAAAFQVGRGAAALQVVSTSPELLLEQRVDGRVWTSPIKGTRPRGHDAASDARRAAELAADPKEQAELSMVVDVERNDLGRVCQIGSVRALVPRVIAQGPVWHRRADVIGRLRPGVTRGELLESVLPSGSVTGAPKVRAMEIIARLEAERRGLYTGGFGCLNHRGELSLAMAIRTLTVRDGAGHYFSGGGIVADSQPALELEETRWKAVQLFGRAGLAVP